MSYSSCGDCLTGKCSKHAKLQGKQSNDIISFSKQISGNVNANGLHLIKQQINKLSSQTVGISDRENEQHRKLLEKERENAIKSKSNKSSKILNDTSGLNPAVIAMMNQSSDDSDRNSDSSSSSNNKRKRKKTKKHSKTDKHKSSKRKKQKKNKDESDSL